MKEVMDILFELKGEVAKNSSTLDHITQKLDNHVEATDNINERVRKLEAPLSVQALFKLVVGGVAFVGSVAGAVLGVLKIVSP